MIGVLTGVGTAGSPYGLLSKQATVNSISTTLSPPIGISKAPATSAKW
jgi:hypothetical protein